MTDARRWDTADAEILEPERVLSLIEAVREGDEMATQRLVQGAMQFLYPVVVKMLQERSASGTYLSDTLTDARGIQSITEDAWEIVHSTCCSMLARLDTFRGRGFMGKRARFTTWLYAIAQNEVRSVLRKRWRERKRRVDPVGPSDDPDDERSVPEPVDPASELSPADRLAEDETRELVYRALEEAPLTPEQREAVILFYVMGYRQDRIADMTGVQVGTVKKRIFDGIRKLRAYIDAHEGENSHARGAKNA